MQTEKTAVQCCKTVFSHYRMTFSRYRTIFSHCRTTFSCYGMISACSRTSFSCFRVISAASGRVSPVAARGFPGPGRFPSRAGQFLAGQKKLIPSILDQTDIRLLFFILWAIRVYQRKLYCVPLPNLQAGQKILLRHRL